MVALLLRVYLGHRNISSVEEILSHRMKGYKQINVKQANVLHSRPAKQYEIDFSMTGEVHETNLILLFLN